MTFCYPFTEDISDSAWKNYENLNSDLIENQQAPQKLGGKVAKLTADVPLWQVLRQVLKPALEVYLGEGIL